MKNKKVIEIVVYTLLCIAINIIGKSIAQGLNLPVWLDSLGTVGMAYFSGPYCGAIVGIASNIIYGSVVDAQSIYCLVNALIGIIVGVLAKKKYFRDMFLVMSTGMILALVCTAVSFVLNMVLYEGSTGNIWGDQIIEMLMSFGWKKIPAGIVGTFYLEFLDKLLSTFLVYLFVIAVRHYRQFKKKQSISKLFTFLFVLILGGSFVLASFEENVFAKETSEETKQNSEIKHNDSSGWNHSYGAYNQTLYSNVEGLSAGEANDMDQTNDGKIWIGTYAGLYSYDGVSFKLHNEFESIKNVNCLYVDEEGRLWVGTNDNGLSIVIDDNVVNTLDETVGLPSNSVRSIVRDINGNYYIGTSSGMAVVSINGGVTITDEFKEIENVKSIATDSVGNVVVVTDSGKLFLINNKEIISSSEYKEKSDIYSGVYFDDEDQLYVGTTGKDVFIFNVTGRSLRKVKEYACSGISSINSLYKTENGDLFVCSDGGVGYIDTNDVYYKLNTNSFNSSIETMIEDYQGNIWFASSRLGLLKLCKSNFVEVFSEMGFDEDVVNAVTGWKGMILFGTDGGVNAIDNTLQLPITNKMVNTLKGVRIRNFYVDSNNNLWVATTGNGIFRFKDDASSSDAIKQFTVDQGTSGNRFRHIVELSDGTIVAAGDGGITYIKDDEVILSLDETSNLENAKTLCLLKLENDVVYAGSDGGGISVIRDGKVIDAITRFDGLTSGVILRMVYDKETKGIFVVTSNGLCFINENSIVTNIKNFPYSNNYDIVQTDGDNLWVLGSAGIYVVDKSDLLNEEHLNYELVNEKNGLRGSLTANAWCYIDGDKNLYLCGGDGAYVVNLDEFNGGEQSYRMILKKILVDDAKQNISRSDVLTLDADVNKIQITPEILNYSMSDPYVSYYLEGFDENPKTVLLSEMENIVYTNLKSGEYTFHISILNSRRNKTIESGSYKIYKEAKMYQKWWFILYMAFVSSLIVAWVSWYFTRLKVQKTVLQQRLELEYARKQIEMGNETILSIAKAVDQKDTNTSQHSFRVSEYSVFIAKKYGFDDERCENLRKMAMLHDIGKIGIPDAILNKPARLDDDEYEIMKTHVVRGGEILKDFTLIDNVAVGALYHHEKYDGTGYYSGLKGEEIPIEARIIGIADAFDAMTANRVYRKKLNPTFVINEFKRCSGTQFDPKLVDILLELIDEKSIDIDALYEESLVGLDEEEGK